MNSAFMEPFKQSDIQVLILDQQVDEYILTQAESYKGKPFANVETSIDDIKKDVGSNKSVDEVSRIPNDEVSALCIWL
jgi:HSP90 family molecular chaperone